jgi:hypothetical protein
MIGTEVLLTGPLTDMATDGFNLRAERVETVHVRGFVPELELDLSWQKPVELDMFMGDDPRRVERMLNDESPWSPFQMASIFRRPWAASGGWARTSSRTAARRRSSWRSRSASR